MNILSKAKNIFANIFKKNRKTPEIKPQMFHVPYVNKPEPKQVKIKATKAYADGRQKAKQNRKRHPSKRMRNIYQTLK